GAEKEKWFKDWFEEFFGSEEDDLFAYAFQAGRLSVLDRGDQAWGGVGHSPSSEARTGVEAGRGHSPSPGEAFTGPTVAGWGAGHSPSAADTRVDASASAASTGGRATPVQRTTATAS
ncbi:hypothetical protein AB0I63_37385, partial [Streptomyces sp. NPDC050428]